MSAPAKLGSASTPTKQENGNSPSNISETAPTSANATLNIENEQSEETSDRELVEIGSVCRKRLLG